MMRKVLLITAVAATVVLAGAAWRWQGRRLEFGSAVVAGHRIHYARHGTGGPALVIIAGGFGGGASTLSTRGSLMTRFQTTAFCYDRPGTGDSEGAKDGRSPSEIIDELHALLKAAGIAPPYVLYGASAGGLYCRAYAMRYPAEVAGLVLVDSSHERQWIELRRIDPKANPAPPPDDPLRTRPEFGGLSHVFETGQLGVEGTVPDVPMVVITSVRHGPKLTPASPPMEAAWRKLHVEIFQSTTHGLHIVTDESGHAISSTEPDLIYHAVEWVLQTVRADQKRAAKK